MLLLVVTVSFFLWDLASAFLQHGHWDNLCFSVPSSFRQTDRYRIMLSAPNLLLQQSFASHYGACLSSVRIQPNFFQLLTFVFGCPISPIYRSGFPQKHFIHILRAGHSHVHRHQPFKHQSVPLWPLDAQISGLAHEVLSLASTSEPRKSAPSKLFFALLPIFPSNFLPPKPAWPSWKDLLQLSDYSLP